ncbi:hypothetical protein KFL_003620100 [Klebsormidium nitens]|uniref:Uncharacterized protein n=1 Tax=Klebsormidium nitens TaxID=105231 RepID=A0A1Y1IHG7_KLENI|nr:hypothetical protein KFL_003620100 [Klebsormidium nitens]|eukprot:GAQ87578.1 hypothetical protein KFL_003620100 [Klebsormidium nitens]
MTAFKASGVSLWAASILAILLAFVQQSEAANFTVEVTLVHMKVNGTTSLPDPGPLNDFLRQNESLFNQLFPDPQPPLQLQKCNATIYQINAFEFYTLQHPRGCESAPGLAKDPAQERMVRKYDKIVGIWAVAVLALVILLGCVWLVSPKFAAGVCQCLGKMLVPPRYGNPQYNEIWVLGFCFLFLCTTLLGWFASFITGIVVYGAFIGVKHLDPAKLPDPASLNQFFLNRNQTATLYQCTIRDMFEVYVGFADSCNQLQSCIYPGVARKDGPPPFAHGGGVTFVMMMASVITYASFRGLSTVAAVAGRLLRAPGRSFASASRKVKAVQSMLNFHTATGQQRSSPDGGDVSQEAMVRQLEETEDSKRPAKASHKPRYTWRSPRNTREYDDSNADRASTAAHGLLQSAAGGRRGALLLRLPGRKRHKEDSSWAAMATFRHGSCSFPMKICLLLLAGAFVSTGEAADITVEVALVHIEVNGTTSLPDPGLLNDFLREDASLFNPLIPDHPPFQLQRASVPLTLDTVTAPRNLSTRITWAIRVGFAELGRAVFRAGSELGLPGLAPRSAAPCRADAVASQHPPRGVSGRSIESASLGAPPGCLFGSPVGLPPTPPHAAAHCSSPVKGLAVRAPGSASSGRFHDGPPGRPVSVLLAPPLASPPQSKNLAVRSPESTFSGGSNSNRGLAIPHARPACPLSRPHSRSPQGPQREVVHFFSLLCSGIRQPKPPGPRVALFPIELVMARDLRGLCSEMEGQTLLNAGRLLGSMASTAW